jgi:ABC-type lipoprotein release transport system permease subunit
LILGILFFIVTTFLISGSSLQNSLKGVLEKTKEKVTPVISIELDLDLLMQEMSGGNSASNRKNIDDTLVEKVRNSEYVREFSVYSSAQISTQFSSEETQSRELPEGLPEGYVLPTNEISIFDSTNPDIAKNNIELLEGKLPSDSQQTNPILVSKKYADVHQLNIGDTLDLDSGFKEDETKQEIKAEISGIYQLTDENSQPAKTNEEATFYGTKELLSAIKEEQFSEENSSLAYYEKIKVELKDPMDTERFISDMKEDGGDYSGIQFNSSYEQYQSISKMIDNLTNIFFLLQLTIFIVAGVIISLIMLLSLRERKYEIGLLLALGETKMNILWQMFLEVTLLLVISFSLGYAVSNAVITPYATDIINEKMQNTVTENEKQPLFQRGPNYVEDTSVKLDADPQINTQDTQHNQVASGIVFLTILGITSFSTIVPTLRIVHKSPKKILSSTE